MRNAQLKIKSKKFSHERVHLVENRFSEIAFSHWTRWTERLSLEGIDLPGVYLLAHFDVVPTGPANPQEERIFYIGESHDGFLKGRLRGFGSVLSNSNGRSSHSGGRTYLEEFGTQKDNIYVAVFPMRPDSTLQKAVEKAVEEFIEFKQRKVNQSDRKRFMKEVRKEYDKLGPLFIKYVERKLIWEYACMWKAAPKCNKG